MRTRQNDSLHVAIGPNANVLSDGKSLHTLGRHRVARASRTENYTSPLIANIIHIHIKHKWNLSFTVA